MFSNKLAKAISALLISMAGVSAAQATTITFDNNTSTIVNFGTDGSYSEAGFSINATSSTGLSIVDSNYFGTNSGLNGTNFGYINNGGIFNLTQTNSTPFSLQSFYAGAIFGNGFPSPTLTLTGTLFGGGSITQTLNLIGNAQGAAAGSSFNLTGWNNLTSVQFQSTGSNINHLAFDNIVVNESPQTNAVPEPTSIALLGLGALGFAASRHKKSA